jgi:mRNA-degrading endonuclease RelE of RelBE toxin-antitoxin system
MTYAVSILRRAQKELQQLPREDYKRVRDAIRALAHDAVPCRVSGVDRSGGMAHPRRNLSCHL